MQALSAVTAISSHFCFYSVRFLWSLHQWQAYGLYVLYSTFTLFLQSIAKYRTHCRPTQADLDYLFGAPKVPLYCFQKYVFVWLHVRIYIYIYICIYLSRWRRRGVHVTPITRWPLRRLLFTRLEVVFVTISSFTKQTKVAHKVFQEGECCLEGLINFACALQLQMLPRLKGHFINVLVWFYT